MTKLGSLIAVIALLVIAAPPEVLAFEQDPGDEPRTGELSSAACESHFGQQGKSLPTFAKVTGQLDQTTSALGN